MAINSMPVDIDYIHMVDEGILSPNDFRDIYMEKDLQTNVWTYTTTDVGTISYSPGDITIGTIYDNKSKHFNCKFCGAPNQVDVCEYCGCVYEED